MFLEALCAKNSGDPRRPQATPGDPKRPQATPGDPEKKWHERHAMNGSWVAICISVHSFSMLFPPAMAQKTHASRRSVDDWLLWCEAAGFKDIVGKPPHGEAQPGMSSIRYAPHSLACFVRRQSLLHIVRSLFDAIFICLNTALLGSTGQRWKSGGQSSHEKGQKACKQCRCISRTPSPKLAAQHHHQYPQAITGTFPRAPPKKTEGWHTGCISFKVQQARRIPA